MDYFIKLWVLCSAACVAAGWILSALHELNLSGYLVFFLLLAAGVGVWFRPESGRCPDWRVQARRSGRRLRRPLPLIFAATALLAALGGSLYAPNNYDALTYRVPRMLHWWSASGWHWMATSNPRMNDRSADFEWLTMPMLVFTHSDRFFFLVNILGYLFMPGLIFAVFIRLGVAARVAWNWMWLLPLGYCYVMQAGSIGNDTIAVVYVLAAVYFSLEACTTRRNRDLWLGILAVGLATGIKGTNLPLVLPMAWALLLAMRRVRIRVIGTAAVAALALLISFVPTAVANHHYSGDWNDRSQDHDFAQLEMRNPIVGFFGNGFELLVETAAPPVLPGARALKNVMMRHLPGGLVALLSRDFPSFDLSLGELPQEEASGLGSGIGCAVAAALLFALSHPKMPSGARRNGFVIGALAWIGLLYFMVKLGSACPGRLVSAFYPLLLIPILIFPANGELVKRRWWKALAALAGVYALTALILTPSRPLWPAGTCLDWLGAKFPRSAQLARAREVYRVYRKRSNILGTLASHIPKSVSIVGLIEGADDSEVSLWYPFGSRKVRHLVDLFQRPQMEWVVVKDSVVAGAGESFDDWVRKEGGAAVADEIITSKVNIGPEKWSIVRFQQ
jgi:hypothetical protein